MSLFKFVRDAGSKLGATPCRSALCLISSLTDTLLI